MGDSNNHADRFRADLSRAVLNLTPRERVTLIGTFVDRSGLAGLYDLNDALGVIGKAVDDVPQQTLIDRR